MLSAAMWPRHASAYRAREASLRWPGGLDRPRVSGRALTCRDRDPSPGCSPRACQSPVARLRVTRGARVMLSAPTQLRHALAHRARQASLRWPGGLDRPRLSAQTLPGRGRDPSPGRFARDCPSPVARLRVTKGALVMLSAPTQLRHALAHWAREASLRWPGRLDLPRQRPFAGPLHARLPKPCGPAQGDTRPQRTRWA